MRMTRLRNLVPAVALALVAMLAFALPASAEVSVRPIGTSDFIYGHTLTLGLQGPPVLHNPQNTGAYLVVRGFDASTACPADRNSGGPVYAFEGFVGTDGSNSVSSTEYPAVVNVVRDVRFCFYELTEGPSDTPTPYSQVVHFRDPSGAFSWFEATSADSPERPYIGAGGLSETGGAPQFAFVPAEQQCPAEFPGGALSVSYAATGVGSFVKALSAPVGVGFWRACGYIQGPSSTPLMAQATFSRAPRGGWKPSYKLARGTLRSSGGHYKLGSVTCQAACNLQVVAKSGKKTLASGSVSGEGTLDLSAKLSSAGRKAAKRGVKASVTITSLIDASETTKVVKLKLR